MRFIMLNNLCPMLSDPRPAVQRLRWYTVLPKSTIPNVARTESAIGTVFRSRIARGMEEPPRMIEAKRLNSIPYGSLFCCRYPPRISRWPGQFHWFCSRIGTCTYKASQRTILQLWKGGTLCGHTPWCLVPAMRSAFATLQSDEITPE